MDIYSEADLFRTHLTANAAVYYPDLAEGPVEANLLSVEPRSASVLYRFELRGGQSRYPVLVKVPLLRRERRDDTNGNGRPRLVTLTPAHEKVRLEYLALSEIQQYFDSLADPRFGAIRAHDFLPEQQALVMEALHARPMTNLLSREHSFRMQRRRPALDALFRNSGAWLRAYHQLPKTDDVSTRHDTRSDFIALIGEFTDFLAAETGERTMFDSVATRTTRLAQRLLPEKLPMGLAHGDYTTRNILVGPGERITVIDTLAKWRAPIYEDIAYFLAQLKTNKLQVMTQGLAFEQKRLQRYEAAFLEGYFDGKPVPREAIQLFEVLLLLDKWSVYPGRGSGGRSVRRLRERALSRLASRYLGKCVRGLLDALEAQTSALNVDF